MNGRIPEKAQTKKEIAYMVLKSIKQEERHLYLNYLLLADESETIVKQYMNEGEMFSIHYEGKIAGVVLFISDSNQIVELKNIALAEDFRGLGLGKAVIRESFAIYQQKGYAKMIVGTANSSIANLAFYQKSGFRMDSIKRDFFRNYPTPIYENGIQALDMVMFEKDLRE
jgi:ribosomal protein S18 acetylase RimI-like enzyme